MKEPNQAAIGCLAVPEFLYVMVQIEEGRELDLRSNLMRCTVLSFGLYVCVRGSGRTADDVEAYVGGAGRTMAYLQAMEEWD